MELIGELGAIPLNGSEIADEIYKGIYDNFICKMTLNDANLSASEKIEIYIDMINWVYEKLNNSSC